MTNPDEYVSHVLLILLISTRKSNVFVFFRIDPKSKIERIHFFKALQWTNIKITSYKYAVSITAY